MKTARKHLFRITSILLCFVMLLVFMPQSILAESGELLGGNDPDTVLEEQKSEPAYVLGEMIDDTMTLDEASEYSGIGRNTLYRLTNQNNCPFVLWVGSKRRIKRKQLDEFISRSYSI